MKYILTVIISALPTFALASGAGVNADYLNGALTSFQGILNQLLPLVVTLALVFFFWGIAVFILNAGDPEARSRGAHQMVWGIVALFVIVGVWGLVGILAQMFGVKTGGTASVPGVAVPSFALPE